MELGVVIGRIIFHVKIVFKKSLFFDLITVYVPFLAYKPFSGVRITFWIPLNVIKALFDRTLQVPHSNILLNKINPVTTRFLSVS